MRSVNDTSALLISCSESPVCTAACVVAGTMPAVEKTAVENNKQQATRIVFTSARGMPFLPSCARCPSGLRDPRVILPAVAAARSAPGSTLVVVRLGAHHVDALGLCVERRA